jgi:hypothetical protein
MAAPTRRAPFLGLLRLDTRFPRPVGDIGNPNTHPFPVRQFVVAGATAERAVRGEAATLLAPFVAAGHRLVEDGAVAIATSCGFLAPFQRELAAALPVPVAASALLQVPWLAPMLGTGRRVGVLTIDAAALGASHLAAAGASPDTPVEGIDPTGELCGAIFGDRPSFDRDRARREVVEAGQRLVARHPEVAAIVLECTNLPPYRLALARATGRPIFDSNTLLAWLWQGAFAFHLPSDPEGLRST